MELYLSFLKTYIFGVAFNYFCLAVLVVLFLVNCLYFTLKSFRYWYKKLLKLTIMIFAFLVLGEFLISKRVFADINGVFALFFSVIIPQSFVYYLLTSIKKPKRKGKKAQENILINNDYGTSIKRAVERIKMAEESPQVYSGYVDVGYIKSLINNLKSNQLEEVDSKEIEEFEIYLLNFVNRQPNSNERQELSARLNGLIKTLSKYA